MLAAAQSTRERGLNPATCRWVAGDIDPIAIGCCAVNMHVWGLVEVLVGCGDTLTDDWYERARKERHDALNAAQTVPPAVLLGAAA